MQKLITNLKERKVLQYALLYTGAVWGIIQVADFMAEKFDWPVVLVKALTIAGFVSIPSAFVFFYYRDQPNTRKKQISFYAINLLLIIFLIVYSRPAAKNARFTSIEKSIAVLPFENIGSEKDNEYISDGITQEIISHLSKIEDLQGVTGWTSARLYKQTSKPILDIGQELGVASVVTGTIQKEGERLRVYAELTDVNTGKQIWGGTYNRKWGDVLGLQSELSKVIAANLNTQLTTDEVRRIESKVTNSTAAYEDFLKGKNSFNTGQVDQVKYEEMTEMAAIHFLDAIKKDSSFALAWSMLGATYMKMALSFDSLDRFHYYDKALTACIRGFTYDPEISETNMYMGDILKSVTLNPFSSIFFLRRAIELNPNNGEAHYLLAWLLMEMGDLEKAEASLIKATQLNPMIGLYTEAWRGYYFFSRNTDKLRTFTRDHNISSDNAYYKIKMFSYFLEKRYDSLLVVSEQLHFPQLMGIAYAKLGQPTKAMVLIDSLKTQSEINWFESTTAAVFSNPHADIAVIYAWLDKKEKAMDHLEWAYRLRERSLLGLRYNPLFDPLRSEERFKELLRRMGEE